VFTETKLISFQMNWEDKTEVKKGNLGEQIVREYLENKGWIIYKSITPKAHAFDYLAVKEKKTIAICEVKTKARLNKYNATGFNLKHYNEYLHILNNYNIDIFIFFIDEHPKEERIYGNFLSVLKEKRIFDNIEYPNIDIVKDIVLFPLSIMRDIRKLTEKECNELRILSTRNYNYD
jgi:hypothetical protein